MIKPFYLKKSGKNKFWQLDTYYMKTNRSCK